MDAISIILTIAACIAGLAVLWFVGVLIIAAIARTQIRKTAAKWDADQDAFRKRHGFR